MLVYYETTLLIIFKAFIYKLYINKYKKSITQKKGYKINNNLKKVYTHELQHLLDYDVSKYMT